LGSRKTEINNIESLVGCFQVLNKEDLEFILQNKTQIEYQKGETVFKQGAFASHVLFVNQGLVKIYVQAGKDKLLNIRLAKSGDFMAFASIFGDEKYQYSAVALTDSIICMINKDALIKVLLRNPEFAMQITSRNIFQESRYLDIIKNVTYKQMRGKLASTILYLTSEEYKNEDVFKFLTRQEIADFASITLESTVKFLKEFEKENIVSLENKDIIVKNWDALKELSDFG
jgi:CRP/FNR family transcriptional regulator